ncbi:hypothetical protein DMC30DRAFT_449218 [Rhodotorula diobovata]|uniref:Ctf8-domain-containing protein n=1 Tax=Rhodotorula diobovata TaxID=5288 RepID=A0A5C5FQE3_9BASI|nr:hypothetical protein DMC30DRAFT_449218 [Rhodotorula diobovata]
MRLPLQPAPSLLSQLSPSSPSSSSTGTPSHPDPPLVFIDNEPFLVELQGSLEGPTGEPSAGQEASQAGTLMHGVRVGKVDLSDPKRPVLRIAHHRLEGKLETLLVPYALLRTTTTTSSSSSFPPSSDEPPTKRARLSPGPAVAPPHQGAPPPPRTTSIVVVAMIRHKLVFSKRPEPLVDVSSEADPLFAERKRAALAAGGAGGAGAAGRARKGPGPGPALPLTAGVGEGKAAGGKGGFFAPRKRPAEQPDVVEKVVVDDGAGKGGAKSKAPASSASVAAGATKR